MFKIFSKNEWIVIISVVAFLSVVLFLFVNLLVTQLSKIDYDEIKQEIRELNTPISENCLGVK